jgi:hypothetical protein
MTAALKMAAPGELCSHIKKLMVFCKDTARSIKGMRQHLAVTQAVMDDLLKKALEQKLLWKQSNGMYKTFNNKMVFAETEQASNEAFAPANDQVAAEQAKADPVASNIAHATTEANNSLMALANAIDAQQTPVDEADQDTIDIDAELTALVDMQLVKADGDKLRANEPASTKALLDAELTALAESLAPEQFPVIEDIDSKQHALAGIAVLLKQRTPALAGLAEQLATDLSVIRLHQERRA